MAHNRGGQRTRPGLRLCNLQYGSRAHDSERDMHTLSEAFGLTRTETCVLGGLIDGRAPKEIAGQLQISTHTVRSHLRAIYAKMDVKGISGTIRLAMRLSQ